MIPRRLRMFLLKRHADALIRRLSRPHVPSVHMTSYPTQPEEMRLGPFYVICVLVAVALVAAVNYYKSDEPPTRACTPTYRKMT